MDSSSVAESSHVALYGAVAVGLFSLWYFFGPSTARTKVRSKEVGYSNTGKHGAPRRHIHSVTKLRGPPPTHKSLHDILRLVGRENFVLTHTHTELQKTNLEMLQLLALVSL